jgi:hypothetical protein
MAVQTTYSDNAPVAIAGMLADLGPKYVKSLKAPSDIPFGIAVKVGATADVCALLAATSDRVSGIVVHSHAHESAGLTGANGVPAKDTASVLRMGLCWVKVEDAVAVDGAVFVRHATSVNTPALTQRGALRSDADINSAVPTAFALTGARYVTAAAAGGLALVEINRLGL